MNDLIESKKLDGLTKEQVRAMLGVPDHENDEGFRYLVRPIGCYVDDWALDIDFERDTVKDHAIRLT